MQNAIIQGLNIDRCYLNGKCESPQNLEVTWNEGELFSGGRKQPAQETICGSDGKASAYNVGDLSLIPGWGRSPGEGNGYPLQYSCLENPMDRGAWWAAVHGVAKSQTWLSSIMYRCKWKILSMAQVLNYLAYIHLFSLISNHSVSPLLFSHDKLLKT